MLHSKKRLNFIPLLLVGLWFGYSCKPGVDLPIGHFDNVKNQKEWKFVKDTNAIGVLDFVPESEGYSARLTWDVTPGGRWIGLEKKIQQIPPEAKGIRLKVKTSGVTTTWLFLTDSLGNRSKYRLSRSITDLDDEQWFSATISFSTASDSLKKGQHDPYFSKALKSIIVAIEPRMDPWYPELKWFPQPKGEAWFDDVEWVTDFDEPLELIENPAKTTPASEFWKSSGVCTHFEDGDLNAPDSIKSVGFNAVRADILWNLVEKQKGKYNFSFFDSIVNVAEKHDIRTLLILDYSNPLYTKGKFPPLTADELKAFACYCGATARFFKGRAVDFEIWNEENIRNTWFPSANALQFSRLLKIAVDSLKSANPEAKVITGGTAGIDWRFIDSLGVNNALNKVDGLGIHPYRSGSPESISEDLLALRWLAKKYFKTYPGEWATEYGASSTHSGDGFTQASQLWQARIDVRALLTNWLAGFVYSHKYEFFTWGDNPKNSECHYGIISPDLKPRPSYYAIQTLKTLTENRTYTGRLATKNSNAYALQFDGKIDKLLILWTSVGKIHDDKTGYKTRFILPEKPRSIYNLLGKELPVAKDAEGKWTVETDGEVVYVLIHNK